MAKTIDSTNLSSLLTNIKNYVLSVAGIAQTGGRGVLAGYETTNTASGSTITVTKASADTIEASTSGATTLAFTAASSGETATKLIRLTASATTTLTVTGATWANGASAPEWGTAGQVLVLVAEFIGGSVVLSVFHNA